MGNVMIFLVVACEWNRGRKGRLCAGLLAAPLQWWWGMLANAGFSHNQGRAKLPQRNPSPHSTHRQPPPPTPKVAMFYFTIHSRTPRRSLENVEKSL